MESIELKYINSPLRMEAKKMVIVEKIKVMKIPSSLKLGFKPRPTAIKFAPRKTVAIIEKLIPKVRLSIFVPKVCQLGKNRDNYL